MRKYLYNPVFPPTSIALLLCILLSGCATPKIYDIRNNGQKTEDAGIISSLGLINENKLSFQITQINHKAVNTTRAAGFIVPEGQHTITILAKHDLKFNYDSATWKQAEIKTNILVQRGHTYIPNGRTDGEHVILTFEDMGKNYPEHCLPLFRHAIFYGGSADGGQHPEC